MTQNIPNKPRNGPPDDNHFQGFFAPIVGTADVREGAGGEGEHLNARRGEFHGLRGGSLAESGAVAAADFRPAHFVGVPIKIEPPEIISHHLIPLRKIKRLI